MQMIFDGAGTGVARRTSPSGARAASGALPARAASCPVRSAARPGPPPARKKKKKTRCSAPPIADPGPSTRPIRQLILVNNQLCTPWASWPQGRAGPGSALDRAGGQTADHVALNGHVEDDGKQGKDDAGRLQFE